MSGKIEMPSAEYIPSMAEGKTSISITKATRDRLAEFGRAGESLETALIRVLEIAERHTDESELPRVQRSKK